jgi:hypothetical protein
VLNTCKWSDEPGLAPGQSRERVSNTWVTCLNDRDNPRKLGLPPDVSARGKEASASTLRWEGLSENKSKNAPSLPPAAHAVATHVLLR